MAAFTYLWKNECRMNMMGRQEGRPTWIAAGNVFTQRGVREGDAVYILVVHEGDVYLIGRMVVVRVWAREDWDAEHDTPNLWEGNEVIEGRDETPMDFHRTIPPDVLRRLLFGDGLKLAKGLNIKRGKLAEPQSLRSVRQLDRDSATALDRLL
jgi:hypothetical protein